MHCFFNVSELSVATTLHDVRGCVCSRADKWTLFNDRKVAVSEEPPFDLGYIYLYESIAPA